MVYNPLNRNLLYTKAEIDAKINDIPKGGTLAMLSDIGGSSFISNIISADTTIPDSNSLYIPNYIEIADGVTLEIGNLSFLEVG
jgi:hypothetical protein